MSEHRTTTRGSAQAEPPLVADGSHELLQPHHNRAAAYLLHGRRQPGGATRCLGARGRNSPSGVRAGSARRSEATSRARSAGRPPRSQRVGRTPHRRSVVRRRPGDGQEDVARVRPSPALCTGRCHRDDSGRVPAPGRPYRSGCRQIRRGRRAGAARFRGRSGDPVSAAVERIGAVAGTRIRRR